MSQCKAFTRSGEPCRMHALKGEPYCYTHSPSTAEERPYSNSLGGLARAGRVLKGEVVPVSLRSADEILSVLEQEVAIVATLERSNNRARTMAQLLMVAIKLIEVGEYEQRIRALEETIYGQTTRQQIEKARTEALDA